MSTYQRLDDAQLEGTARNHLYLTFSDLDSPYSILQKVVESFALSHSEEDCLIVSVPKDGTEEQKTQAIYEFAERIDADCGLYVRCTEHGEIPALISTCGTLITSRVSELVRYTCIADLANTKVISGVDIPVF